ncbi:hypothetical protein ZWY2020_053136 [Hordeum vulgare]|nr:hypothetical protein ZWY2020_053136 [Hordeum vulgare]
MPPRLRPAVIPAAKTSEFPAGSWWLLWPSATPLVNRLRGRSRSSWSAAVQPFDLEDLLRVSAEVLGKGAIGTTYKAVLESSATVAVKGLKDVTMTELEFRDRIADIGELEHEFIVPLRAYYYSKDEKLLVYDFMPMGSLSAVLHDNTEEHW